MSRVWRRRILLVFAALALVVLLARQIAWFATEWLWFSELGYRQVFLIQVFAKVLVGLVVAVIFFFLIWLNLIIALRLMPWRSLYRYPPGILGRFLYWAETGFRWSLALIALAFAVSAGIAAARKWESALLFWFAQPSGEKDPLFFKDISFYLFRLPFFRFLLNYGISALLISLFVTAALYGASAAADLVLRGRFPPTLKGQVRALIAYATPKIRRHLLTLAAILLLAFAAHYRLAMFELLYGKVGDEAVWGAGFTDVKIRLPSVWVLMMTFLLGALLVFFNLYRRTPAAAGIVLISVFCLAWLTGSLLPRLYQRFVVKPNEVDMEKPYLAHSIKMTRIAYGLYGDRFVSANYPYQAQFTEDIAERYQSLLGSVRLWDYRWLKKVIEQVQSIRPYYQFNDVDIDRYRINGVYRQVMLSARELNTDRLRVAGGQTWLNRHLRYTHGYGVVVAPVNEVEAEGLPVLWVKDIPPRSQVKGLEVKRPEIYFGELTTDYVVVRTGYEEFDYPIGAREWATCRYQGKGGIPVGSFFRRLAFALRFADPYLFLSGYITSESRILFRRLIRERLAAVAPFLVYDDDPYLVIDGGRLFWMCDAYTTSQLFPYSEPITIEWTEAGRIRKLSANYIRNSVKAVVDAYHGTTTFYIADPSDPIIQTYSKVFPGLFRPLEEMPLGLRRHIRYPVRLFQIQAERLRLYHIDDPEQFYSREDLWDIAQEDIEGTLQQMEPYYVMMTIPSTGPKTQRGNQDYEFALILPMTPMGKPNLVSLLVARCDLENYGQMVALEMPRGEPIFGPALVDARIKADPYISQQMTLWGQQGSQVRWGNLLVIPLDSSVLYVKPLFLVAEQTQIPELKRVVVATHGKVRMAETLPKALALLTTETSPQTVPPVVAEQPPAPPTPTPTVTTDLVARLDELEQIIVQTEESARRGDWSQFGAGLQRLRQRIQDLKKEVGADGRTESTAPLASP
ncbi:MAG: UPF0182 family protein [Armatimonadetes bacterium]|nr:UPF0182 family protein [Armatimonadota bacterium]MDW8122040.1 UPF0182 family protein [Armatimonadota bacterium]